MPLLFRRPAIAGPVVWGRCEQLLRLAISEETAEPYVMLFDPYTAWMVNAAVRTVTGYPPRIFPFLPPDPTRPHPVQPPTFTKLFP